MTPYQFLLLMLGVTAAALAANMIDRRLRQRTLAELAREWAMHYSPTDVFHLAPRIAPHLPVIGAADVHVLDVIYGNERDGHRFIFSVEYTAGVVRAKHRVVRVASFREDRNRSESTTTSGLELADAQLPLVQQYRTLHERHAASTTSA